MNNAMLSLAKQPTSSFSPLVSVICRTVNRPLLKDALTSVAQQTYRPLEIVLVDAAGTGLQDYLQYCDDVSVRLIGGKGKLSRSQAANAGLEAAMGEYLLFLDDDDWIGIDHIVQLLECRKQYPDRRVIYSSTQKASSNGELLEEIVAVPFDPDLLKRDNYIPIHAALFHVSLRDAGCHFDESLDIYEDWDFWLQCAELTDFVHHDHLSAFYRMGGASETQVTDERLRYQSGHPIALAREKILDKWRLRWSGADINRLLGVMDQSMLIKKIHGQLTEAHEQIQERGKDISRLHRSMHDRDKEIDRLHRSIHSLNKKYQQLSSSFEELTTTHTELKIIHSELEIAHAELNLVHQTLDRRVREILSSFSWRAMGPYRWLRRRADLWLLDPVRRLSYLRKFVHSIRKPQEAIIEEANSPVQCEIVIPAEDEIVCSENFTLHAWAWSPGGLQSIELYVDDGLYRSIAADYLEQATSLLQPDCNDAKRTGFVCLVDSGEVQYGEHLLTLQVRDKDGNENSYIRRFFLSDPVRQYRSWFKQHQANADTLSNQQTLSMNLANPVTVSILVTFNGDCEALRKSLQSISAQSYIHWQCAILVNESDGNSGNAGQLLDESGMNSSVAVVVDSAVDFFNRYHKSGFYAFLDAGEVLSPDCLWHCIDRAKPDTDILYTDHSYLDDRQQHCMPWFTFSWSPELLFSCNYIGGFYLIRSTLLQQYCTDIDPQYAAWRYALLLAITTQERKIERVPRMLWSAPLPDSEQERKQFCLESEVLENFLQKNGRQAELVNMEAFPVRYVKWQLEDEPKVSIIIPTTGNPRYLKPCLNSLREITTYRNFEIILLDNSRGKFADGILYARNMGSDVTVIDCDQPFNWSRLNNIGVSHAKGELLLFLNDDIEVKYPEWMHELVRQVVRKDIGTVGSLLLYPNGAIQHAGVFLVDHGGGARHLFHKQLPGKGIYRHLDQCVREVSANTGACLMISRDKFEKLGGFDEKLAVVGNDIDLCLRCLEAGYRNLWTPHSRLIHHESVSRQNNPIGKDEKAMWQRWKARFLGGDPYYNPCLSLEAHDCSLPPICHQTAPVTHAGQEYTNETGPDSASLREYRSSDRFGVNLIAYIRAEMGVGEAARGNAAALEAAGIPFGIINYERGNPSRMDNLSWQHKEIQAPVYDINILHINADHTPAVVADLGPVYFRYRYNIGFWAWELPEFPDRWLSSFDYLDEIWVPSMFVNKAIAAKSPIPVFTVPHAIDVANLDPGQITRRDFMIPENVFVFLSMFDIHSIAQRKNPYGAINAFKKAFAADDNRAMLAIKVNNADSSTVRVLQDFIGDCSNILVIDKPFGRHQINALIASSDCFVSLHHSEGFGLGPAEAMALGKVALLTNWSGNTEYMRHDNCIPVDYELKQLGKDFGPYEAHQYWAHPDIEQAAREMRKLVEKKELAKVIAAAGQRTINSDFSPQAIGRLMATRLNTIKRILAAR